MGQVFIPINGNLVQQALGVHGPILLIKETERTILFLPVRQALRSLELLLQTQEVVVVLQFQPECQCR